MDLRIAHSELSNYWLAIRQLVFGAQRRSRSRRRLSLMSVPNSSRTQSQSLTANCSSASARARIESQPTGQPVWRARNRRHPANRQRPHCPIAGRQLELAAAQSAREVSVSGDPSSVPAGGAPSEATRVPACCLWPVSCRLPSGPVGLPAETVCGCKTEAYD